MHFRLLNIEKDYALLKEYCNECEKLGYLNNSSIRRLNLDIFNNSLFLIGLENDKIVLCQRDSHLALGVMGGCITQRSCWDGLHIKIQ